MSTVVFNETTSVTLNDSYDRHRDNEVARTRTYRVISERANKLHASVVIDFADTLRELGADQPGVKGFRIRVDSGPERGPHTLIADWSVDLDTEIP